MQMNPDAKVTSDFVWHLEYGSYIWNNTGDTAEIYTSEADFNAGNEPLARRTF